MKEAAVPCPICKTAAVTGDNRYRPFCSRRCQLIDLGNWLGERYVVPGPDSEPESRPAAPADDVEKAS